MLSGNGCPVRCSCRFWTSHSSRIARSFLVHNDFVKLGCRSQSIEPGDHARQVGMADLIVRRIWVIMRERRYTARNFAVTKFVEADSAVSMKQRETFY
jgi:hypothetical protein